MDYILLVEPNTPLVAMWFRDADRLWQEGRSEGLDASVELPELGLGLAMRDVYDGVSFPQTG